MPSEVRIRTHAPMHTCTVNQGELAPPPWLGPPQNAARRTPDPRCARPAPPPLPSRCRLPPQPGGLIWSRRCEQQGRASRRQPAGSGSSLETALVTAVAVANLRGLVSCGHPHETDCSIPSCSWLSQRRPVPRARVRCSCSPHLFALVWWREEGRPAVTLGRSDGEDGVQAAQQRPKDQHLADAGVAGHAGEVLAQRGERPGGRRLHRANLLQRAQCCRRRGHGSQGRDSERGTGVQGFGQPGPQNKRQGSQSSCSVSARQQGGALTLLEGGGRGRRDHLAQDGLHIGLCTQDALHIQHQALRSKVAEAGYSWLAQQPQQPWCL